MSNNPWKTTSEQDDIESAAAASYLQPSPMPSREPSPSRSPRPLSADNPFFDPPNAPPPAYNFHAEASNIHLPPNTYRTSTSTTHTYTSLLHSHSPTPSSNPSRSTSPNPYHTPNPYAAQIQLHSPLPSPNPFKRSDEDTIAAYKRRQKYNKRRFLCFLTAIVVMVLIALVVAGVAFKWGRGNVCVRWSDGSESGKCD